MSTYPPLHIKQVEGVDYSKVEEFKPFMVAQASNGDLLVTVKKKYTILVTSELEVFDLVYRDGDCVAISRNKDHKAIGELPE